MITWNFDPEIFSVNFGDFHLAPRWYSLSFIIGFLIGYKVISRIFFKAGRTEDDVSSLLVHCLLGTIIGARLGHCLFYDPVYYLSNPLEILKTWKGGLASHGGYLGLMIGTFLFLRKMPQMSFFWLMDIVAPLSILTGSFIRIGNFLNSEILGRPGDVPWAVVFEKVDQIPRHPTQLYESFGYLTISLTLLYFYTKLRNSPLTGRILGASFTFGFSWRFFIEFFKENQEAFEQGMLLNMGQLLSIPFILLGIYLMTGKQHKVKFLQIFTDPINKNERTPATNTGETLKKKTHKRGSGKKK